MSPISAHRPCCNAEHAINAHACRRHGSLACGKCLRNGGVLCEAASRSGMHGLKAVNTKQSISGKDYNTERTGHLTLGTTWCTADHRNAVTACAGLCASSNSCCDGPVLGAIAVARCNTSHVASAPPAEAQGRCEASVVIPA